MTKTKAQTFSTALSPLAARLIRVATPSVLLAACGTTPPHGGHGGAAGAPTDSGSAGTTSARDLPPPPAGGFAADGGPVTGYPQCYSLGSGGFTGPCCLHVRCVEPQDGDTECMPADQITSAGYLGLPGSFGSGSCPCDVPSYGAKITGLYTRATAQPYSSTQGPCCYLVPYQTCVGRPLILEGRDVVAPLAFSSGWV
ncbi:MAG TPA: hypothetical protein VI072_27730 [Polyangiaceae bacterium]